MAGSNCKANASINHQYWFRDLALDDVPPPPTVPLAAGPIPYDIRFTAENFGLKRTVQTVADQGTGSPWEFLGSEIETQYAVNGPIRCVPRPEQMPHFLPALFGRQVFAAADRPVDAPAAGDTYGPAGVICDFFHMAHLDPTILAVFHYQNLVTNTFQLTASEQAPLLTLDWNIEGSVRLRDSYNKTIYTPDLPLAITQPWVLQKATVKIGGINRRVRNIAIGGNNNLATDGYYNGTSRSELPTQFQQFTFSHETPFDLASDLSLLESTANVSAEVVFTSGTNILTIGFPSLFARGEDPAIQGRSRVHYQMNWKAQYDPNVAKQVPMWINLQT